MTFKNIFIAFSLLLATTARADEALFKFSKMTENYCFGDKSQAQRDISDSIINEDDNDFLLFNNLVVNNLFEKTCSLINNISVDNSRVISFSKSKVPSEQLETLKKYDLNNDASFKGINRSDLDIILNPMVYLSSDPVLDANYLNQIYRLGRLQSSTSATTINHLGQCIVQKRDTSIVAQRDAFFDYMIQYPRHISNLSDEFYRTRLNSERIKGLNKFFIDLINASVSDPEEKKLFLSWLEYYNRKNSVFMLTDINPKSYSCDQPKMAYDTWLITKSAANSEDNYALSKKVLLCESDKWQYKRVSDSTKEFLKKMNEDKNKKNGTEVKESGTIASAVSSFKQIFSSTPESKLDNVEDKEIQNVLNKLATNEDFNFFDIQTLLDYRFRESLIGKYGIKEGNISKDLMASMSSEGRKLFKTDWKISSDDCTLLGCVKIDPVSEKDVVNKNFSLLIKIMDEYFYQTLAEIKSDVLSGAFREARYVSACEGELKDAEIEYLSVKRQSEADYLDQFSNKVREEYEKALKQNENYNLNYAKRDQQVMQVFLNNKRYLESFQKSDQLSDSLSRDLYKK